MEEKQIKFDTNHGNVSIMNNCVKCGLPDGSMPFHSSCTHVCHFGGSVPLFENVYAWMDVATGWKVLQVVKHPNTYRNLYKNGKKKFSWQQKLTGATRVAVDVLCCFTLKLEMLIVKEKQKIRCKMTLHVIPIMGNWLGNFVWSVIIGQLTL